MSLAQLAVQLAGAWTGSSWTIGTVSVYTASTGAGWHVNFSS